MARELETIWADAQTLARAQREWASAFIDRLAPPDWTQPTPYRLFSKIELENAIEEVRAATSAFRDAGFATPIAYSVKTNPDHRVLEQLARLGLGFECISNSERALVAECAPDADLVVLNGPVKAWPDKRLIGTHDYVIADRQSELDCLIEDLESGALRVNALGFRLRGRDATSRFGFALGAASQLDQLAASLRRASLKVDRLGAHVHLPASSRGSSQWRDEVASAFELLIELQERTGQQLQFMDLGGGFSPEQWSCDGATLAQDLAPRLREALPGADTVIFEPGRCLVQRSIALFATVRDIDAQSKEVLLDASVAELAHWYAFTHLVSSFSRREQRWRLWEHGGSQLSGRTCMEHDVLARAVAPPADLALGDCVVLLEAGGYDFSLSFPFGSGGQSPALMKIKREEDNLTASS